MLRYWSPYYNSPRCLASSPHLRRSFRFGSTLSLLAYIQLRDSLSARTLLSSQGLNRIPFLLVSSSAMTSATDEKAQDIDVRQAASSSSSDQASPTAFGDAANGKTTNDVDAAWTFLNEHRDAEGVSAIDINALRRKIDWHIVPLMFCCYTMQFLDKVILNVRNWPLPPPLCTSALPGRTRKLAHVFAPLRQRDGSLVSWP